MLSLFSNKIFLGILCGVLVAIIGIIAWKYHDLSSTIEEQEKSILEYKNKYLVCQVDLEVEQHNITVLKSTIENLNLSIEKLELKNKEIQKIYDDYKKQAVNEKYQNAKVIDIMKSKADSCEEGKRINKILSGLTYDSLE